MAPDPADYSRPCSQAVDDVLPIVMDPSCPDLAYRRYVNVDADIPSFLFGAHRTIALIRQICQNRNYTIEFVRVNADSLAQLHGFASWLVVNFKKKELTVLYDDAKVQRLGGSTFERDRTLAKVFLHECAHASLHLDVMKRKIAHQRNPRPSLDMEHEQEAWLYALTCWGIFTGEHAYCTRKYRQCDEGWTLA